MIRLEGVSKRFGEIEALAPLDLEIADGEWLGVFGRNGSGKSSLLRMLIGLSRPSTGRVLLDGKTPSGEDWRTIRRRLGYMPERVSLFENLTGEKTLRYFARLKGVSTDQVGPLLERVGLSHAGRRRLSGYSKGMLQRLNFAQALLGAPRVLVVDEPIEGLDAHGVRDFFEILKHSEGRTVVISSHRMPLIARHVDRMCVLSQGRVTALGTEDELHRELDLPARIILHPMAGAAATLVAAIEQIDAASVVSRNGRVVVSLPQQEKIRFLAGLGQLEDAIHDIRIEEPSLEEVLLEKS